MNSKVFQFPKIDDFKSIGWHALMIALAGGLAALAQTMHITTGFGPIVDMGINYVVINFINKWVADNTPKK